MRYSFNRILVILYLSVSALALSSMVAQFSSLTYQTGIINIISDPTFKVNDSPADYTGTFASILPTTSLNGSLGVASNHFDMGGNQFGWMLEIKNINNISFSVTISTNDPSNYVRMLKVCYLVNWGPNMNVNYYSKTFDQTVDVLANNSLSSSTCNLVDVISCRSQSISGVAYNPIANIDTVNVFLAGFYMTNAPAGEPIGIKVASSSMGASGFTLKATVYSSAEVISLAIFYISYAKSYFKAPYYMFEGPSSVGSCYTTNGCNPIFPLTSSPSSNVSFSTPIKTNFLFYSQFYYMIGIYSFIAWHSGTDDLGDFDLLSTFVNSNTTIGNTFAFTGNSQNLFNIGYNYMELVTAFCPTVGDIYQVYNSNMCDSTCANGVQQYPDNENVCQKCSSVCYKCTGSATVCTQCYNLQNRVISGNTCICDPIGFYDDGVSLTCPQCYYNCKSCSGPSSSDCLTCESVYFRTIDINTCPCNSGYYDNYQSLCQTCKYSCLTCSGGSSTSCVTCDANMHRNFKSDGSCQCMTGYYDTGTNTGLCSLCLYSCLTCLGSSTTCTSCDSTLQRTQNGSSCVCSYSYFDNGVALCASCHATCGTCNGPLINNCVLCDSLSNRGLEGSMCKCKTSYYDQGGTCFPCHFSCYNCTDGTSTGCTSCNTAVTNRNYITLANQCICSDGYYDENINVCPLCDQTCLTCSGLATYCLTCNPAYHRSLAGSSCPCDSGYVDTLFTGPCSKCHYSCLTCTQSTTSSTCNSCLIGSLRVSSGFPGACFCPSGTYDNGYSSSCQPCNIHCVNCVDSYQNSCTFCDSTLQRTLVTTVPSPLVGSCQCNDRYYDSGSLLCSPCDSTCLKCNNIPTNCTSCDSTTNHRIIASNNTCICQNSYYEVGGANCLPCSLPCLTCTNLPNNCTSCYSDRTLSGSLCYCNSGTYEASSNLCLSCHYSCSTCSTLSITCNSCPSYSNRYQSGTTCPCLTGYYDSAAIVCSPCLYSCYSCSGASTCIVCPVSTYRTLQANSSCTCDSGYYDDGSSPICKKCSVVCATCKSYSQCLTCDFNLQRTWNSASLTCPCNAGYYDDAVSISCQSCDPSCKTCFAGTAISCYDCPATRTFTVPNSCPCSDSYYQILGSCTSCSLNCKTCKGAASNCTSCAIGSYLSNFQCLCNLGYYMNGFVCYPCDISCQTCSGTSTTCTACNYTQLTVLNGSTCSCPDGKYQASNLTCISCSSICLTCSAGTNSSCIKCNPTLYRTYSSGYCNCNQGYYEAGLAICQTCNPICVTCNGPSSLNCTSCSSNYTLMGSSCVSTVTCINYYYDGQCLNACPNTTYPSTNLCLSCINNCLTCTNSINCLSCLPNKYYSSGSKICLDACPLGEYSSTSNTCISCPDGCSQCSVRTSGVICSACISNYYLILGNCSSSCPIDNTHVLVAPYCFPCQQGCATCTSLNSGFCLTCSLGYFFYSGMCLLSCPEGFYGLNNQCIACGGSCVLCSSGTCLSCLQGYYLNSNGFCISQGYFVQNGVEQKCHPNCETCTNSSFSSCITCSKYRGDSSEFAISGYCDCWVGSIEKGNGQCDISSFKTVEQMNKGLVSLTSSANFFSLISSVITFNFFCPLLSISYQQLYSTFYYLNSSAVMQIDSILNDFGLMNLNRYLQQNKSHLQTINNPFNRLLMHRQLITQTDQSLFMRGNQYMYFSQWAIYSFVTIGIFLGFLFLSTQIIKCKTRMQRNKIDNNDEIQERNKKQSIFMTGVIAVNKFVREKAIIIFFLLTLTQCSLYGLASFKIIAVEKQQIDVFKLVLSILLASFYLFYLFRLFYIASKQNSIEDKHIRILFAGFLKQTAKSRLARCYIPMLALRSLIIAIILVFGSSNPQVQTIGAVITYFFFTIYSLIFCPYAKGFRIFLHTHEAIFLAQISILAFSASVPQLSRINPAMFLLFFNFVQTSLFISLSTYFILTTFYSQFCEEKIKQEKVVKKESNPVIFDLKGKQVTEENLTLDCEAIQKMTQSENENNNAQGKMFTFSQNDSRMNIQKDGQEIPQLFREQIIKKRYRKRKKNEISA